MQIIPVLDIMDGLVVRGVGGRRREYRPISSRLCDSPRPLHVAEAFRREFGIDRLYLADLDALTGGSMQLDSISGLCEAGFRLAVDAGTNRVETGDLLLKTGVEQMICPLEASTGPDELQSLIDAFGPRMIFSLDLKRGMLLTERWPNDDPFATASRAIAMGVQSLIVLDLAAVGGGCGIPTLPLCRRLRERFSTLELISGGGVDQPRHLDEAAETGLDGVLVASALHDGRISPPAGGRWQPTREDLKTT